MGLNAAQRHRARMMVTPGSKQCYLCGRVGVRAFLWQRTTSTGWACLYEVPCMNRQRALGKRPTHPLRNDPERLRK